MKSLNMKDHTRGFSGSVLDIHLSEFVFENNLEGEIQRLLKLNLVKDQDKATIKRI